MRQIQSVNVLGISGIKVVEVPPPPTAGPHQVTVAVRAAGVNFFDLYTSLGLAPGTSYPALLGLEAAGVVMAVGGQASLEVGARVVVHCPDGGAFSDVLTVDEQRVLPLPDTVSFVEAATLTVSYLTAEFALNHAGCLKPGGNVFIHSAAGSVGWAATQLAKLTRDVTVFGTASEAKLTAIAKNGVDYPISHDKDYMAAVREVRTGGVSLVLDCLAGPHFKKSQQMLEPFGKVVLIGAKDNVSTSGPQQVQTDPVSPYDLIMNNSGVTGLHLNEVQKKAGDLFRATWREILDLAVSGNIRPRVHACYPVEEAREACRQLQDRINVGKVVLEFGDTGCE